MPLFTSSDRTLWRLALPMILSNISVPLLGIVDTAIIGHLDSPVYLGGVAVGATATSFVFMLLLFLRMSTTGLTAQAFGARDKPALARALIQPMLIALTAGVLFIALRTPVSELAAALMGGSEAVQQQAQTFIAIRWLSAPATLANLVILGWLLGVQYARAPMVLLITGNVVNILLDLLFVLQWHWGVAGAAAATAVADYVTLAVGLWMVARVLALRGISFSLLKASWRGDAARLFRLNRDIMLRSLLLQLCFASLTLLGARLGADVVAVNAVLLMFLTFTAYALDGFAYAVEACSGEATGAGDRSRLRLIWYAACRQAGIVALLFAVIYALCGPAIIALLTSIESLREAADRYLIWQVILPLAGVWCYLLDGMFIGATRGRDMRNSMLLAALGYALTLLTLPWLGNHGLWLAITVFLALRGITLGLIWRHHWQRDSWFSV
ncbi:MULTISPECIES: MATE family efflux transporter DinF [Pantoea]|jgi:MATE family multidrug resistance protein|uniref:MATE family efflux transporter DinF n=1 Tax=Pantoea TaxID=53335 RepID=UPI000536378F|nr:MULTISPECIES: MATE family efflux transporter DinF [Pantoea]AIX50003.1 damage-inducible protein [Pantoea sp. PSNIH1]KAA6045591.1 MATE family efflux transporter DinF [Pantoea sp. Bo_7]KAA6090939.1 MATE family efflux transporter DinF [Pantoea sp. Bo_10]MCL9646707.1 MATE family efflux transporter DinF [Pantoea eucrina]MDJ0021971.1 MATE family efflux transporter DinF [Pantoea eucrina]